MAGVVLLAGGTGGAKLARGLLDELGPDLVVIANTGDDLEIYGAYVSPDPDLVTFWLADAIDERGWGLKDDTFAAMDQLRRARPGRVVQPRRPRPRDRPAPRRAAGQRARLTEAIEDLRRAFGVPRAGAGADRRSRPHARAGGRPLARVPGLHDPVAGRDRGRRVPRRARRARARGPRRAARRAGDHRRPVEPGDLDRPDPGRARARRSGRPTPPSSPSRRSSTARCSRARRPSS